MNTLQNKIWCVILSLAMLVNLLPVSALASETTLDPQASAGTEVASENEFQLSATDIIEEGPAVIVQEDVSLRNEFTKHFQMSDGSYTATVYNEPVHQLIDGEWVEVDNSLQLSTSAKGVTQYQTVNGLTDVSFAQTFRNELVTMEQDEHSITWGVVAAIDTMEAMATESAKLVGNLPGLVQAEILPAELSGVSAEEQKTFATKATSTIQYSDALATGVDLQYTVLPSRIKESIILNQPQVISAYTVNVNTSNLSARLLDNREVEFYTEDGEIVFTMWAPYMYDSASELSEDIEVELTALGNGQYAITLTPDADWLNSPDRIYPVVIDPDVTASRAKTNIIDNTVMEGQGVQNKNLDRLYIGRKSGACVRAFLKYDVMPTIPSNATITAATQTLYITANTETGSTAGAYIVTGGDWSSDTIEWANRPTAATAIQTSISHNNFSYYRFSCLSAVQKWYTGSTIGKNQNYGITVRYTNESINDYNAVYSADCSVESNRPLLTITYQWPITICEGTAYQLAPSGISGTINWTSSNISVATVNSLGQVTGVKAGTATITAYVGNVAQKTYTFRIVLLDGVYRIKSNNGFYLGTGGGLTNGTSVGIYYEATSDLEQLRQLWKVTHLGDGYYTLRPLYKLDMVLCAPTANTAIWKNTASDTLDNIERNHRWTISYHPNGGGYLIKCNGSDGMALKPADPGSFSGLNATIKTYSASSEAFNWTFEKLSNPPSGVLLYELSSGAIIETRSSRYIPIGTSKTPEELDFAAYAYSGGSATSEQIAWSCTSGSSHLTIDTNTGKITALSPGTAIIRGNSTYGNFELYITVTGRTSTDFVFVNQYDLSFTRDSELFGLIDDAVTFVNNAYQKQFAISFSSSTSPYYRTYAITDECPLGFDRSCHRDDVCGDSCKSHHKNIEHISNQFNSSTIPKNHVVVFWTDRNGNSYCDNGATVPAEAHACVYDHRPVIHIMSIDNNSTRKQCMAFNLAHEFVHTLGMDDKYYSGPHSVSCGNCVMEKYPADLRVLQAFYENVSKGDQKLFCSSCEAEIEALLAG